MTANRFFFGLVFLLLPVLTCTNVLAFGDYLVPINDSYDFVRCNSIETVITTKSGKVVFSPMDYVGVGPLVKLSDQETCLFLETIGRKRRSNHPSDTYENPDPKNTFYFVVNRIDNKVLGPMSFKDFQSHIEPTDVDDIEWTTPRVKYTALLFAALMFTAGIIALVVFGVVRAKKRKTQTGTTND